jgi:hypothetical protein
MPGTVVLLGRLYLIVPRRNVQQTTAPFVGLGR